MGKEENTCMVSNIEKPQIKLFFVQGGTRIKRDDEGNLYTDGNYKLSIWKRYMNLTSKKITALFREDSKKYTYEEAQAQLNYFDNSLINCIILPDLYRPKTNYISFAKRKVVKEQIEKTVKESDCLIIRSLGNVYVDYAIKFAIKYNKPYLVEVTGVYWDNSWYHSFLGKVMAPHREFIAKSKIQNAPYALYVTERSLQRRYPCKGISIGCSDVELQELSEEIIINRKKKIQNQSGKIILGTAGFVSLKTKGQHDVIKALGKLKKEGITNYQYQLIGLGDDSFLRKVARENDVEDEVVFLGSKTHEDVFNWLDEVDIYIQPSYQEGLCRAIVEAMSRGCPIICSNAGGNNELIEEKFIFPRGKIKDFLYCLNRMDKQEMMIQAQKNFSHAKHYNKDKLDAKRFAFFNKFINDTVLKSGED